MKDGDQLVVLGRPANLRELDQAAGHDHRERTHRLTGPPSRQSIREELKPRVAAFTARAGRPPGLGIVLVGTHAPSEIYVRNKLKAAGEIGCRADLFAPARQRLPQLRAARRPRRLNASEVHDGILVQDAAARPRWAMTRRRRCSTLIDPAKDVDGFTPVNAGRLVAESRATWPRARPRASSSCSCGPASPLPAPTPS